MPTAVDHEIVLTAADGSQVKLIYNLVDRVPREESIALVLPGPHPPGIDPRIVLDPMTADCLIEALEQALAELSGNLPSECSCKPSLREVPHE